MGEIHELFVLALSLVWFAGATPEQCFFLSRPVIELTQEKGKLEPFWEADLLACMLSTVYLPMIGAISAEF